MAEQVTEDKIKGICREMIDTDCEKFCALRHQPLINEVETMKTQNDKRDGKLDSILKLAYGILGGIIVSLAVQLINLLGRTPK